MIRQEENHVFLDDYELKIKAYRIHSKYGGASAAMGSRLMELARDECSHPTVLPKRCHRMPWLIFR